ncbi:hypothetical protein OHC33_007156 [Knufia fluminis]|uniref:Cyclin-like protein n=1 Tax=Knufia fluminis TaxID=191047 RepID=A0AAN8EHU0_9EURO|nr:hypothetical protein OHC33_007156 [Knufia fluminis]
MAAYNRWGSHAPNTRLPPTPPEYQTTYLNSMSSAAEDVQGYHSSRSHQSRHSYSARDYNDHYQQMPAYSAHQAHNRSKQLPNMGDYAMNYPQPLPVQYHYAPAAPPILPPIQVPDDMNYLPHYSQSHMEAKQKEEKPTGGVAQHLDYEMDLMANFVAEMCQQMVSRISASPTPQFRKYVSQILSSTRLPSSTIMLGLFYLQERMKFEKADLSASSSLMKMLTTCLLLGSKFLDDNTFQNRSWAEVSNIPVQELNAMELAWLKDFNWEIHGLMYDPDQGFFMWIEHWHSYEEKAQVAQAKSTHKLAPINTNLSRHSHMHQPMMSPEGPIPPQYQHGSQYDAAWPRQHVPEYSPPSTHHSGPTTPDYYNNNWQYATIADTYSRASWNATGKPAYSSQRAHPSPYYASQYGHGYQHVNNWSPHGAHCGCSLCSKHSQDYYMSHQGYHVQPVVG